MQNFPGEHQRQGADPFDSAHRAGNPSAQV